MPGFGLTAAAHQARRSASMRSGIGGWLRIVLALCILALTLVSQEPEWVMLYPVAISLGMLFMFTYSLMNPPNVIERIARAMEGNLPPEAIAYTRKVCLVWIGFFVLNACISAYTVWVQPEHWLLYNGLISYVLMGTLFAVEFAIRLRVKNKHARQD